MHIILNEKTIRQIAFKKKRVAPVPMSLLVHLLGFCFLSFLACLYGVSEEAAIDQPVEIELAANELTPEEAIQLAQDKSVTKAGEVESGEPDPVWGLFVPSSQPVEPMLAATVQKMADNMAGSNAGAVLNNAVQQAAEGGQAPLAAQEAVATGDGVAAAGAGNPQLAEGGQSYTQGMVGKGTGAATGADDSSATGNRASADRTAGQGNALESISDIAARFAARVEANKKYPHMAMKRNQQGVVYVYATLGTEGSLVEHGISSSSGVDSLDKAALQAVERSCPFSHGAGHAVTFTVPIHFELY